MAGLTLRSLDKSFGPVAVVRDETARWAEEGALKARVRELEAATGS